MWYYNINILDDYWATEVLYVRIDNIDGTETIGTCDFFQLPFWTPVLIIIVISAACLNGICDGIQNTKYARWIVIGLVGLFRY